MSCINKCEVHVKYTQQHATGYAERTQHVTSNNFWSFLTINVASVLTEL